MMSRKPRVDHALLEREYVYDSATPPVSLTALADKHGFARSHMADLARRGKWYEKRKEVRHTVGEKVLDALTDRWAETDLTLRERMLASMIKTLDVYDRALDDGEIKVGPREAMGVVAAVRALLGDVAQSHAAKDSENTIDVEQVQIDPKQLMDVYEQLKQRNLLVSGEDDEDLDLPDATGPDEPGHARPDAPADPAGTEQG